MPTTISSASLREARRRDDGATATTDPQLAIVIIARNEERWIGTSIAAALRTAARFPHCEVILVDSRSTDATVAIAGRYPIRIVELNECEPCCAALGRVVGQALTRSRHVLFVDGDTEIDCGWVVEAVELLEARPDVAGVGGKLRELYYDGPAIVGENPDCFDMGDAIELADQLGGNALYRRSALDAVGSFNPYIFSYEEAELAERLRRHGFSVVRVPRVLGTHRTGRPGTVRELWRRYRGNLIVGYGQVLRASIADGLFWRHARRMNRYLAFDAILLLGAVAVVVAVVGGRMWPLALWAGVCALLLFALMVRARSIVKPLRLVLDWTFWAVPLVTGFVRTPRDPRRFSVGAVLARDSAAEQSRMVSTC